VAALKKAGFIEHPQRGSHLFLIHPDNGRKTVVPIHAQDIKRGTLSGILGQAGLSVDAFLRLL
jgi:predicted RNA binding protein YcfA (HicA-like mRNA interferase family)